MHIPAEQAPFPDPDPELLRSTFIEIVGLGRLSVWLMDQSPFSWMLKMNLGHHGPDVKITPVGLQKQRVRWCRAVGLQSRAELNDKRCTVESWSAARGRYTVRFNEDAPRLKNARVSDFRIEHGGETVRLRPQNVIPPKMCAVELCDLSAEHEPQPGGDACAALNGWSGRVAGTVPAEDERPPQLLVALNRDADKELLREPLQVTVALENCRINL